MRMATATSLQTAPPHQISANPMTTMERVRKSKITKKTQDGSLPLGADQIARVTLASTRNTKI